MTLLSLIKYNRASNSIIMLETCLTVYGNWQYFMMQIAGLVNLGTYNT